MRLPQLWSRDEAGLLKWVSETIALFNNQISSDEVNGAPVSSESAGMTRVWLGATPPSGWLKLDGTYVWITEAQDLYDTIGSAGASPPNMFKLPAAPSALASGMWIVKK